ncbi:hypothetical protein Lsan_4185 [Legionella santicrucis]|uniref:Uncharacterized protein n=1 Tax=Legionella santicrucis TaxID=45074 RepID=A0A0W0YAL7_9GAMM|nr:hypothetical protein [Legionella santicrucis]KTD53775.1 hypothetical protein Lsan_4185 [Legionella santicrucis]
MKKTLQYLELIDLENLKKVVEQPNEPIPEDVLKFLKQYEADSKKMVACGFNATKIAENIMKMFLPLAAHPAICKNSIEKLDCISRLYGGSHEVSAKLMDLHSTMSTINTYKEKDDLNRLSNELKFYDIKEAVDGYVQHLKGKCQREGVAIGGPNESLTPKQAKLLNRYNAMNTVNEQLKEKHETINECNWNCNLNIMSKSIDEIDVSTYKNSFVYNQESKQIYFITYEGQKKEVNIGDFELFDDEINKLPKNDKNQVKLSNYSLEIKNLINKNGGYIHSEKPAFTEDDKKNITNALEVCITNQPAWSERPYLQRLTDILSFGFKMLYREFCSKEDNLHNKLESRLNI